ncbi:MAG: hypothetical protein ACRBCI_12170 [Cellvibrionaceae bacterium]
MSDLPKPYLAHDADLNQTVDALKNSFLEYLSNGLTPSGAIRTLIEQYPQITIINSGEDWLIVELLKAAYPDMERQGIGAWLYENHYPERVDLVSDGMFDQKILALAEQAKIR